MLQLPKYFGLTTSKTGMRLEDFGEIIRKITGRPRDESREIASIICRVMGREFAKAGRISFRNFCTLKVVPAVKRKFVMLHGKPRKVKKKWRIVDRYSKKFKDELNKRKKK
jgi:nucleoid DNA-binding protein